MYKPCTGGPRQIQSRLAGFIDSWGGLAGAAEGGARKAEVCSWPVQWRSSQLEAVLALGDWTRRGPRTGRQKGKGVSSEVGTVRAARNEQVRANNRSRSRSRNRNQNHSQGRGCSLEGLPPMAWAGFPQVRSRRDPLLQARSGDDSRLSPVADGLCPVAWSVSRPLLGAPERIKAGIENNNAGVKESRSQSVTRQRWGDVGR